MHDTKELIGRAFERYRRLWVSMARRKVRSLEDAEDCVSEGVASALVRAEICVFRDVESVGAWVFGFIRNAVRKYWDNQTKAAKERKQILFTEREASDVDAIPMRDDSDERFHCIALDMAAAAFSPFDRHILTLTARGYTLEEIGALYGVTKQAIHKRLEKATGQLSRVAA